MNREQLALDLGSVDRRVAIKLGRVVFQVITSSECSDDKDIYKMVKELKKSDKEPRSVENKRSRGILDSTKTKEIDRFDAGLIWKKST